jgi:hypothetical protein
MLNSALGILKQYQDSKQIGLFLFPSLFNRAYALPKVELFYSQNGRSHSLIKHEENIVICTRSFTKRSAMLPFCETFHFSHLALSHFVKAFSWDLSQNGTLPHYLLLFGCALYDAVLAHVFESVSFGIRPELFGRANSVFSECPFIRTRKK